MNREKLDDSRSVVGGFYRNEFADLSPEVKQRLFKLMARICEKSYRRGFQQAYDETHPVKVEVHDWRFFESLDDAVDPHWGNKEPSLERLAIELDSDIYDLFDASIEGVRK